MGKGGRASVGRRCKASRAYRTHSTREMQSMQTWRNGAVGSNPSGPLLDEPSFPTPRPVK